MARILIPDVLIGSRFESLELDACSLA